MKKKFLVTLPAIVAVFLAFGISACNSHTHSYNEWTAVNSPTCTQTGTEKRECSCGASEERTIAALGHDFEEHQAQAATCTEAGCNAYQTCTRCDYTTYEELPATGHSFSSAWSHDEDYHWHDAICGHNVTSSYAEHIMQDGTCTVCGYAVYEVQPHEHSYESDVTTRPTCTAAGLSTYTCRICGDSYTEEITALGHDIVQYKGQSPSCLPGWEAYEECTRCDYSTYKEIPATGEHIILNNDGVEEIFDLDKVYSLTEYSNSIKLFVNQNTDCDAVNYGYFVCRSCGNDIIVLVTTGHDIVQYEGQSPTCIQPGWEAYEECTRCDYSTYKEIPATDKHIILNNDGVEEIFDPDKIYLFTEYSNSIFTFGNTQIEDCLSENIGFILCIYCNSNLLISFTSEHKMENGVCTVCGYPESADA